MNAKVENLALKIVPVSLAKDLLTKNVIVWRGISEELMAIAQVS